MDGCFMHCILYPGHTICTLEHEERCTHFITKFAINNIHIYVCVCVCVYKKVFINKTYSLILHDLPKIKEDFLN